MKIEKNVPIPVIMNSPGGRFVDIFKKMEVGDSFYVKKLYQSHQSNITHSARIYALTHNVKFKVITRKEGDGFRVWRIE